MEVAFALWHGRGRGLRRVDGAALAAVVLAVSIGVPRRSRADEPPRDAPTEREAPPPEPAPATLPPDVTPIDDAQELQFELTGGARFVARRVGEDPAFLWVEREGQLERVRKTDIAATSPAEGVAPAPTAPAPPMAPLPDVTTRAVVPEPSAELPPVYRRVPGRPAGRGFRTWGIIITCVSYGLAVAAAFDDGVGDRDAGGLRLIPVAGAFLYAAFQGHSEEATIWSFDGALQVLGAGLFTLGIYRGIASAERPRRRRPDLSVTTGPSGTFVHATWHLAL